MHQTRRFQGGPVNLLFGEQNRLSNCMVYIDEHHDCHRLSNCMVYIDEQRSISGSEHLNSEATDPNVSPKSQVSQSQLNLDLDDLQKGLFSFTLYICAC